MTHERILIVDDEKDLLAGLQRLIRQQMPDLSIDTLADPTLVEETIRRRPADVILLDIRMPVMDGMTVLRRLAREDPNLTCIMMTAFGSIEQAVEAMKIGAYDFITKPFDPDGLVRVLGKALERNRLIRENRHLKERVPEADFHGMIGCGPAMRRLFGQIRAVARSDYAVLIRGESGTGKELAARALHAESPRRKSPLVTVNCPATPEHLLESELFGHRRGAFTGADRDQKGLFEEAHGGTMFLDEIADIPVSVQTKLLRALQEGEIKPLGATRSIQVDVRILAATNQDVEAKIRQGTFRQDLFYRLNVVTLQMPTLAQAADDIGLLADHFARVASGELDLPVRRLSPEALECLAACPWPGNVRQLQNEIRRAVMFSQSPILTSSDFGGAAGPCIARVPGASNPIEAAAGEIESYETAKDRVLNSFTLGYVERLLTVTGGNVTRAAELSGLRRASLQKILRRLGVHSDAFRE